MATPGINGGFIPAQVAGEVGTWTQSQRQDQQNVTDVHERMRRIHWDQASLVTLHPWALMAQGYLHHDLRINPAPFVKDEGVPRLKTVGERELTYSHHVFTHYKVPTIPTESGMHMASEVLPIELAVDFIVQHQGRGQRDEGGLFCYVGAQAPHEDWNARAYIPQQSVKNIADLETMTVRQALELAHAKQVSYYTGEFEKAEEAYADPDKRRRREINNNRRKIAMMLRAWGVIQQDPAWLTLTHSTGKPLPNCPSCGADGKPGALRCTNGQCTHIFDAFKAFEVGVIGLDTPGALNALRRLDKKELKELGIYPAVKPMSEYLSELNAAATEPKENKKDK